MIYLDHNATTPVLLEVFEAMRPYFCEEWGNPSSSYRFGSRLKTVIETAREQVAELIGARPGEVVFTSCATESNNAAIHAALKANPAKRHVVTSAVEHSSVLNYCMALEKRNYRVTYLPVDHEGSLKLADLEAAITDETAVVSLMWANNETGVLFPVEQIAGICRSRGVLFHCDGVQAAGKTGMSLQSAQIDYLSLTGHKLNAPKGIGALYVRRKVPFSPYLYGGHQEKGRRGGTESVPLIVGFGKAAEIARRRQMEYDKHVRPLRDALENGILGSIPGTSANGGKGERLANTTNISFSAIESEALIMVLDQCGICVSSGSACLADSDEPSHVLAAMKRAPESDRDAVRFSFALANSAKDVEETLVAVLEASRALRAMRSEVVTV